MENYRVNRLYAITVSPPMRKCTPKFLYEDDVSEIRRWCNKWSSHYLMYPEFDLNSRLHYHGIIKAKDLTKMHKTRAKFSRQVGFVKLKPLLTFNDHLKWLMYCRKDLGECFLEPFYYKNLRRNRVKRDPCHELDEGIMMYFR